MGTVNKPYGDKSRKSKEGPDPFKEKLVHFGEKDEGEYGWSSRNDEWTDHERLANHAGREEAREEITDHQWNVDERGTYHSAEGHLHSWDAWDHDWSAGCSVDKHGSLHLGWPS